MHRFWKALTARGRTPLRRQVSSSLAISEPEATVEFQLMPPPQLAPNQQLSVDHTDFVHPLTPTNSSCISFATNERVCQSSVSDARRMLEGKYDGLKQLSISDMIGHYVERMNTLNQSYRPFILPLTAKQMLDEHDKHRKADSGLAGTGMFFSIKDSLWGHPFCFRTNGSAAVVREGVDQINNCKKEKCRKQQGGCQCVPQNIRDDSGESAQHVTGCKQEQCHKYMGWCSCQNPALGNFVARLLGEGAILLGTTNIPPFCSSANTTSPFVSGATRNAFNPKFTCGGSTGGGAVATQVGLGHVAFGTDKAGSIRVPAALTGTIGIKPAVQASSSPSWLAGKVDSMTAKGLIVRCVDDAALALDLLEDAQPCTSFRETVKAAREVTAASPARVGFLACHPSVAELQAPIITEYAHRFMRMVERNQIAKVSALQSSWQVDAELSGLNWASDIVKSELHYLRKKTAASNAMHLATETEEWKLRMEQVLDKLNPAEVLARRADYKQLRNEVGKDTIPALLSEHKVLFTPALAALPWDVSQPFPTHPKVSDPFAGMAWWNVYSYPFNWSNTSAATFPCGYFIPPGEELPVAVGMQVAVETIPGRENESLHALIHWLARLEPMFQPDRTANTPAFFGLRYTNGLCCEQG
jgi:Asp-tRNA(Asn)/Glu-tRNA(Gln) amidotransferase A subunit family amidase